MELIISNILTDFCLDFFKKEDKIWKYVASLYIVCKVIRFLITEIKNPCTTF